MNDVTPHHPRLPRTAAATCATVLALLLAPALLGAQGNLRVFKRNGLDYFAAQRYANAAEALVTYRNYKPKDRDVWYPLAVSHYQLNQLTEARTLFEGLVRAGKRVPDDAYLYLGRLEHHEGNFAEAARQYKRYLGTVDAGDPLYSAVVDDIRRVGYGASLGPTSGAVSAYAENLGAGLNGPGDEFHPLLSPNYQDRMYFATIREGVTGGFRDAKGFANATDGELRADMYSARVEGGRWGATEPLSYLLNTADNEVAQDFGMEGRVLVFWKGTSLYGGDLHVDTFRAEATARTLHAPLWTDAPLRPQRGDNDLHLFNDSTIVFASPREEGAGGFDLYVSTRVRGVWREPMSLGATVNTAYDERSPFLAADGRTLYFSSNRADRSVGGFDVFRVVFDARASTWGEPQNLGLAINTAGDELNFRLALSGLAGYYDSSVRAGGFGGRDLYAAYFKDRLAEQRQPDEPITFVSLLDRQRLGDRGEAVVAVGTDPDSLAAGAPPPPGIPVTVQTTPLLYGADDNVLTPGNLDRVRPVIRFLEEYPGSRVVITAHTDDSDPERFRAYFGIKRAERFAAYLAQRGIDKQRISLLSVGSLYPLAANRLEGAPSDQGRKLNRRLELHVVPGPEYALTETFQDAKVPDFLRTNAFERYREQQRGAWFRVELATLPQMYDEDAWMRVPVPSVQADGLGGTYRYAAGAFPTYRSASNMADELRDNGFPQARVTPYLNGIRLTEPEVVTFAPAYEELSAYHAGELSPDAVKGQ